jgi:NADPH-dependent curcumin reductase CurA
VREWPGIPSGESRPKIEVFAEALERAVLPSLNTFARVPVCGLIAQYSRTKGDEADLLPATMRAILTKSVTLRASSITNSPTNMTRLF